MIEGMDGLLDVLFEDDNVWGRGGNNRNAATQRCGGISNDKALEGQLG